MAIDTIKSTAVLDGAIATADIADLSLYGTAFASNGNASGGVPSWKGTL